MDNLDRNPGLKYPTNIPKNVPIEVHQIIRNIYDNLFFDRKHIDNLASLIGVSGENLQNLIQSSVVQAVTNNTTTSSTTGILVRVSTHAIRVTIYGAAADPVGTIFIETDRTAIYYISDASGIPHWEFAAGQMVAPKGSLPTDLGVNDQGFTFTATEDHLHTQYIWSGTGWLTVGPALPVPPGVDGIDGEDGIPGPMGMTGPQGGMGIPGPPGYDGEQGDPGDPGVIGPPGPDGAAGSSGGPGIPGSPGYDGTDGVDGDPGPMGLTGPAGAQGAQGNTGLPGPQGDQGDQGDQGETGQSGAQGDGAGLRYRYSDIAFGAPPVSAFQYSRLGGIGSTTEIDISNFDEHGNDVSAYFATWDDSTNPSGTGYVIIKSNSNAGTVVNIWQVSAVSAHVGYYQILIFYISGTLPTDGEECTVEFTRTGDKGSTGSVGAAGAPGVIGPAGVDGLDGDPGAPGPQGFTGPQGAIGIPGPPSVDGLDGEDGLPGPIGLTGSQGSQGIQGIQGFQGPPGLDGDPPEEPIIIPGPAGPAGASGGAGNTGTATLDFGAFPGSSDASIAVTGQASIVAGSLVQAWIRPVATADHTDTEHMVETIQVIAGNIIAGTGFTIYGFNTSQLNEPVGPPAHEQSTFAFGTTGAAQLAGVKISPVGAGAPGGGGIGTRIYGQYMVAWGWS